MLSGLSRFIRACIPSSLKLALAEEVQRLVYTDNKLFERNDLMFQANEQHTIRMFRELEARIAGLEERLANLESTASPESTNPGD